MNLCNVTPMIITYNEQANLRDTLERLSWASEVLIIDSGSTDETLTITGEFSRVRVITRKFDHFADQCNFGLTQVKTPWVLSLDADYKCDLSIAQELPILDDKLAGFEATFIYGIYGKPLRATLYPPRIVLYRVNQARYVRDGHAHRIKVNGSIGKLATPILHDDLKPLSGWLTSQSKYAVLEAEKLLQSATSELGWKDRLRLKIIFAPVLTILYCLFWNRLILDGWPGIFYTLQRAYAELLLSLELLDRKVRGAESSVSSFQSPEEDK